VSGEEEERKLLEQSHQSASKPEPKETTTSEPEETSNIDTPTPREVAARKGSELVKEFKEQGVGQQAGRSGGHGEPYKKAGAELIRQANRLTKNSPLKEALKIEGNRLIKKGKSISHPGR
jgi:hypothetical protein